MTIEEFVEAEFKKLVPYKPLTGPEIAAIKLSFVRWLKQQAEKSLYPDCAKNVLQLLEEDL